MQWIRDFDVKNDNDNDNNYDNDQMIIKILLLTLKLISVITLILILVMIMMIIMVLIADDDNDCYNKSNDNGQYKSCFPGFYCKSTIAMITTKINIIIIIITI